MYCGCLRTEKFLFVVSMNGMETITDFGIVTVYDCVVTLGVVVIILVETSNKNYSTPVPVIS